ncbi:TPM domain-containing protein [Bradyrhizobium cenepequi]|uniref:TPM domain-containing protein n=1 Tax=Bradyrhizobium cenepequi TaxID=2821403 RepID=UPI001CE35493|nr:YgcG family protein [Bradyrhizobium cenepequi]MCA6108712.1 YgcG family protein [Bradyrhizobium cenepequi]
MNAARAILLALLVGWIFPAFAEIAVPPLTGRVVDETGTLSSSEIASLTQTLEDLEKRKGSQIAVLIVPTTGEETIEQFSIRVAEAWKIGRRKIDDGALLVIAKDDRHLRIEVGYGLEGVLTDATTRRIIDEVIAPKFKSGDFAGGVAAGVSRMIRLIDGEQLPAPEPEHWQAPNVFNQIDPFNPFVIVGIFVLGSFLRTMLGRLLGAAATGGIVGFFAWLLAGSFAAAVLLAIIGVVITLFAGSWGWGGPGGYRRGGWPGGGHGGSWSGGGRSRDSGGFSGRGGSFGGGGASGSW